MLLWLPDRIQCQLCWQQGPMQWQAWLVQACPSYIPWPQGFSRYPTHQELSLGNYHVHSFHQLA
eukprot:4498017-Prorocentrum_lima.AAC.1